MVLARSGADIPVVMPSDASTETVNAVFCDSELRGVMGGNSSSLARAALMGAQIRPRP